MGNRLGHAYHNNMRRGGRRTAVMVRDTFPLRGGINLVDSALEIKPGELLIARNYEPYFLNGAYERVQGHEVFDGRPRPHLAEYWKVELTDITGGPFVVGETVTASPSGETATVASYTAIQDSDDDEGYLIITDLTDEVDENETWTGGTSGASGDSADGSDYQGEADEDLHDTAQLAAESIRRSAIEAVGGTACAGPVRGVHIYGDVVYAFRDNVGQTEGTLWKSSGSGWVQVSLGHKIRFESGSQPPQEGDTLTGASSSASCTVERVVVTGGYWAGGDAEGYIITTAVTGGPFTTGENLQVSASTYCVAITGTPQEAQTLNPGGEYKFRNYNFGGHSDTLRMYGVSGVDYGFEFDGDVFVQIETGMTSDTPSEIGVHRGHLLFAYPGGSLQHSGKNLPLSWLPVTGANELLAGDEITGFIEEVGDVTFVFTRNKTFRLEGFVQENIQLKLHNYETGAIPKSLQRIGRSVYLDDRGFTNVPTTSNFGDFASNAISTAVEPLVQSFLAESSVVGSVIHRGKSLYRCFFNNGEAITIGFSGNKVNGITTIAFGINVTCTVNGEIKEAADSNGIERVFVGADDGFVYETDVGRNFNGEEIEAYIVTAYHFSGDPEYNKRYRRMTLYMEGDSRVTMTVYADYDYNEDPLNFETVIDKAIPLGGGRYGISRHGRFLYSASSKSDIRVPMNSHARNVSAIFYSKEANEEPHRLYAITYHISRRRMIRH